MNMLLDSVPESLLVAGTEYPINTDFRVWIRFEQLLTDPDESSSEELFNKLLKLVFPGKQPPRMYSEETAERILWFYQCGKPLKSSAGSSKDEIFSYDYDDGYISAAFMEQYHVDLNSEKLHWWKFHAYMLSLSETTEFVKIMGYRAVEINPKMSSAQKSFYQKMKKHYRLPVKKELREKNSRLEDALLNGEPIDNLL